MTRLFVIDDRDQTIEMCHKHLGQFDYVTRCDRNIPCQVCDLRDKGCALKCAHDYAEAAETLARLPNLPDLVVLDLHFAIPEERLLPEDKSALPRDEKRRKADVNQMRRKQGLLILRRLRRDYPALPIVMLTTTETNLSDLDDDDGIGGGGPDPMVYFCENEIVDSRSLVAEITRALKLRDEAEEGPVFWGQSPAMADLRRSLEVLARSPLPTLLQGETGTGKSFLAEQVIHPRSGLKGPFVVTDLSTIPAALLPAHLFGARRGSFTGAVSDQEGVFEQAHGGTLFLDEIANLDLDLQRQLLLVIERGEVQRLGEATHRKVVVKLVAATNQDLGRLVREGRFRVDLYLRLNPATRLLVPPLRERSEDLPALLRFGFLQALSGESLRPLVRQYLARFPTPDDFDPAANEVLFGKPRASKTPGNAFAVFIGAPMLARLTAHPWTGNTRELKAFATNALVWVLAHALDTPPGLGGRAPAVLSIPDRLILQLLAGTAMDLPNGVSPPGGFAADGGARGGRAIDDARAAPDDGLRITASIRPRESLSQVSVDVERQYLSTLFRVCKGDMDKMAKLLLGPHGSGRRIHLRLNQIGLGVKKLRDGL